MFRCGVLSHLLSWGWKTPPPSAYRVNDKSSITSVGFTPIIPHPATEYGTIFTRIKNYQDVLKQKNISTGALWCDEGVYRIAKELQLMHPNEFENIFLGLGGFHTEKAVIACVGRFLEDVGVVLFLWLMKYLVPVLFLLMS